MLLVGILFIIRFRGFRRKLSKYLIKAEGYSGQKYAFSLAMLPPAADVG